jgi:beta-glucanase (GH16 family)
MDNPPYVIVLGAPDPVGVNGADFTAIEDAVKPICLTYGAAFVSPITGDVIDGQGNVLATTGPWITAANNADFVNSFDNLHANNEGQSYIAAKMAEAYHLLPVRVSSSEFNTVGDWTPDLGRWGAGDGEQQDYTASNYSVSNGQLVIQVRQETPPDGQAAPYNYTSTRLITRTAEGYAPPIKIVARIKMPDTPGLSPAFWAVGLKPGSEFTWPQQGEIDIAEAAINPNTPGSDQIIGFNLHGPTKGNPSVDTHAAPSPGGAQLDLTGWHDYEIDWRKDSITWAVDGTPIGTVTRAQYEAAGGDWTPFSGKWPVALVLSVAVGNTVAGDTIGTLPAEMTVDYVRAYKLEGNAQPRTSSVDL